MLDSWAFHRRRWEMQRDELQKGWSWQGWSLLGAILLDVLCFPFERGAGWTWPVATFATLIAVLVFIRLANLRKANRLHADIDARS